MKKRISKNEVLETDDLMMFLKNPDSAIFEFDDSFIEKTLFQKCSLKYKIRCVQKMLDSLQDLTDEDELSRSYFVDYIYTEANDCVYNFAVRMKRKYSDRLK